MKHSHWLVLYDIRDPRRLKEVEKIVSSYCERVQKSVYEYSGFDDGVMGRLRKRLEGVIEGDDVAAILPLCERDWRRAEKYGKMEPSNVVTGLFEVL